MTRGIALLLAALLVGCSASDDGDKKEPPIHQVAWNLTDAPITAVRTIADLEDSVVFFSDTAATVMIDGAVQGVSGDVGPFRSAAAIPAADGSGRWIVAIDQKGRVLRVALHDASIEDISGRYGLEGADVRSVVALDQPSETVAFLIGETLAIADGQRVRHWTVGPTSAIAPGPGKVALVGPDNVRVFDVATSTLVRFPIQAPRAAAFGADGRLYVAAGSTVHRQDGSKLMAFHRGSAGIHAVVRAGKRVWFAGDGELGFITEQGAIVATAVAGMSAATALISSSTGDVWTIGNNAVLRFAAAGTNAGAALWEREIKPIFTGNCAACHLPGGLASIDLSTFDRWNASRSALMRRVVTEGTMPPSNSKALSSPDRQKVRAWLTGQLDQ